MADLLAGIYIRVSGAPGQRDNYSPEFQLEYCRRKAGELGAQVVDVYQDVQSAKDDHRPEFQRLLADVRAGRINCVIVYNVSRFSRANEVTFPVKAEFRRRGVVLSSATEAFDDSPSGDLVFGINALMAEDYRLRLGRLITDSKQARASKGLWNGDPPFGYRKAPIGERSGRVIYRLEIEPSETAGVRLAFDLAAQGETAFAIAQRLNALGLRSHAKGRRQPQKFDRFSVRGILRNRFYTGVVTYKGEAIPGQHPAIIDQALFDQAQTANRRARLTPATARHTSLVYPLSGLLYCYKCGTRLRGEKVRNGARAQSVRYYRDWACDVCLECDQARYLRAEPLEEQLADMLGGMQIPDAWIDAILARLARPAPAQDTAGLRRRLENQVKRLNELFVDGLLERRDYDAQRAGLTAELGALPPPGGDMSTDMRQAAALLKDFRRIFQAATPEEKKKLFRLVLGRAYTLYSPDSDTPQIVALQPTAAFYPLLSAIGQPNSVPVRPNGFDLTGTEWLARISPAILRLRIEPESSGILRLVA